MEPPTLYAFSTIRTRLFTMLPLCSAIYQYALAPPSPTPDRHLSTGKGVANSPYQATNRTLDLGTKSINQTSTAALDSRNLYQLLSPLSPILRLDSCTSYHASQTWFRPSKPKPKPTPLTCPPSLTSPVPSLPHHGTLFRQSTLSTVSAVYLYRLQQLSNVINKAFVGFLPT